LKQFKAGDSIRIIPQMKYEMYNVDFAISSVESDTHMTLKEPALEASLSSMHTFRVLPKLSQTQAFSEVIEYLKDGGCLSVFPEGCSHD
jgi:hypothetical protein